MRGKGRRNKMPGELWTQFCEWIHRYFPAMCLAAFGTIVHALNEHNDEWSWKRFVIGIVTAFFVGLLMCYLLDPMDISPSSKSVAIAISGYLSNDVLRAVSEKMRKKIGFWG